MRPARPRPSIVEGFRARRRQSEDDAGYIIIIVLVIAMIVLSLAAVAMQASMTNDSVTSSYANSVQSHLASETALNVGVSQIAAVTNATPATTDNYGNVEDSSGNDLRSQLPSQITVAATPTSPGYTATVAYTWSNPLYQQSGAPSTWTNGSLTNPNAAIWPSTATITALGTAPKGSSVKMIETVGISPPVVSVTNTTTNTTLTSATSTAPAITTTPGTPGTPGTTTLLPGYGAAIFSGGQVSLSGNVSATTSSVTTPANIVAGNGIVCPNNVTVQGSIYSYSTSDQSLSNNCTITGSLYSVSGVTLSNSVSVGGDLWSYGTDGITLNNTVKVSGNATATKGAITTYAGVNIVGNAAAAGVINYNSGSQSWYGTIHGVVAPNNSTGLAGDTMPTEPTFPTLSDPTQAQWQGTEYTNVITVTNAGTFLNGTQTSTTQNCSTYFNAQYLAVNNYQASASQFNLDVNAATTPTAIDASACSAPNLYGPNGTATYTLHTDVAVTLSGLQTSGTNTFTSSSSTTHNLSIIVPSPGTGGITLSNNTTFATSVSTLLYTLGTVSAANASVMNGQILADASMAGSNNFALTFSSSAALTLPGTTTTTAGTPGSPGSPTAPTGPTGAGATSTTTTTTTTVGGVTTTIVTTTTTASNGTVTVSKTTTVTTATSTTVSTTGSTSALSRYVSR
jgi:hypothetical protein